MLRTGAIPNDLRIFRPASTTLAQRVFSASSATVLPPNRFNQSLDAEYVSEASGMSVLVWVGSQILKERLPPRLGSNAFRHTRPGRVDSPSAFVADQFRSTSHRYIVASSLPMVSTHPSFARTEPFGALPDSSLNAPNERPERSLLGPGRGRRIGERAHRQVLTERNAP